MNEFDLLVFRAGETASKGITTDHLDQVISGYDPAKQPGPIVIGHPTNDAPAHGVVSGLYRKGSELFARCKDVSATLVDKVKKNEILSRSIALWEPSHPSNPNKGSYSFRHLGFLGAQAPGIPNLGALKFSAEDDSILGDGDPGEAVIFAAASTPVKIITDPPVEAPAPKKEFSVTEEEIKAAQAQIDADKAANAAEAQRIAAEKTEFAAQATKTREAANAQAVDGLITAGVVAPADKDALVLAFNAIPGETLEFSAEDKTSAVGKIVSIMSKCGKIVPVGDKPITPSDKGPEFNADDRKAAADAARDARTAQLSKAYTA